MRLLFTFAGGHGHFLPLLPLAHAARRAGHAVAFACQAAMAGTVAGAGFRAFDTGGNTTNTQPRPLLPVDIARERRAAQKSYAGRIAAERARNLLHLCRDWRPDVLVRDEMDFGTMAIAERLGLPCATVLVIAAEDFLPPELLVAPLAELRAAHALPPDPALRRQYGALVLSPFPAALRDPPGVPMFRFRSEPAGQAADARWRDDLPSGPLIHATLGTVFNLESGDLFARMIAGLRQLPAGTVMTVGDTIDPDDFAPLPANIRIYRHVPVAALLPGCGLVVSQGGSGIVTAALAHGLPSLLLPMGADQPLTAARCAALGAARLLDPMTATPAEIRDAAASLLADPAPRRAAAGLAAEMRAFPGADEAAARITALS